MQGLSFSRREGAIVCADRGARNDHDVLGIRPLDGPLWHGSGFRSTVGADANDQTHHPAYRPAVA
jgi:hypothetical protein